MQGYRGFECNDETVKLFQGGYAEVTSKNVGFNNVEFLLGAMPDDKLFQ